jgi:hypothetical protein
MKPSRLNDFWSVADFMRRDGRLQPANATYLRAMTLAVAKTRWTLKCAIHVVPMGVRGLKHEYKSSVSVWPTRRDINEERRLEELGWYDLCRRTLFSFGYRGRWDNSPQGKFVHAFKRLAGLGAVRAEASRFDEIFTAFDAVAGELN